MDVDKLRVFVIRAVVRIMNTSNPVVTSSTRSGVIYESEGNDVLRRGVNEGFEMASAALSHPNHNNRH